LSAYIAVDIGAESGRVVVGEIHDDTIRCHEVHRFSTGAVQLPGELCWDVLRIFAEIKDGLRAAIRFRPDAAGSVSVDTWGIDFALLDRDGALLSNPVSYRDPRNTGMMEEVIERCGRWNIFQQSGGIQFLSINTLNQLYSMVRKKSTLLDVAATFLMIPDLFHYWLSGERGVEFTNATTTQFYDATRGAWSLELLKELDIPAGMLPQVIPSGTVLGPLRGPVADDVGAQKMRVVAGATHDTASAVVAIPAGDDACWISSGTWSLVGAFSDRAFVTPEAMSWNISNYGGFGGGFVPWRNVMGLWLIQECRRAWLKEDADLSYAAIADMAEEAPPFRAVIDPDHPSFLAPSNMPAAIQAFCRDTGQPVPETKAEIARTAMEGLALRYRWTIEGLRSLRGRDFSAVHVVGGGSRNASLCRLTADATGLSVVAGPEEAAAMGNVAVQAIATGAVVDANEARQLVIRSVSTVTYEPRRSQGWDDAYERFCSLVARPAPEETA
jgi:rhamnulokinase